MFRLTVSSDFVFISAQPATGIAYSHPSTPATYTVQQAPPTAHTVTAAYAPVPATQAVRPVTSAAYGSYPTAHSVADYSYGQRQPEAAPQQTPAATQNYQVTNIAFPAPE